MSEESDPSLLEGCQCSIFKISYEGGWHWVPPPSPPSPPPRICPFKLPKLTGINLRAVICIGGHVPRPPTHTYPHPPIIHSYPPAPTSTPPHRTDPGGPREGPGLPRALAKRTQQYRPLQEQSREVLPPQETSGMESNGLSPVTCAQGC